MFPMVPLGANLNLGVAIVSYNGELIFGLVGDFVVMHDLEDLADDFVAALQELTSASAANRAQEYRPGVIDATGRETGARLTPRVPRASAALPEECAAGSGRV